MNKKQRYRKEMEKLSLQEINMLVQRQDELTDEQRKELRDAILLNDEAREFAIRGAIRNGNWNLAFALSIMVTA